MGNLHVIIGEDDFLVASAAGRIVGAGAGLEVIDSANSTNAETQLADLREADASFSTPPFLEPRKVTWWKNVHFLPGGGKAPAADVKAALEKFASKLASSPPAGEQHFILSGPHLLKTSVFAKTVATVAEVVSFAAEKPWEAARNAAVRVIDLAAEMGLSFDRGAAELFVSRVGVDSRSLISELGKMRDYLGPGDGKVTAAAIGEIASQGVGVEPEVWAITDALGERNLEKALAATRRFEQENGFAVLVTTVVERFFRQLVELKTAMDEKGEAALQGMNAYAARKNSAFLRNWTLGELRLARWRFLTLRERAVSSAGTVDALVCVEMVRACGAGRGRVRR
jgi:DNA polymerase III delta subunit